MGTLIYFPLLYFHIKFGGNPFYYALAASFFPIVSLVFEFTIGGFVVNILLFFINVVYFFILGRIHNPLFYVLFALFGGVILFIIVGIVISIIEGLLGISLESL